MHTLANLTHTSGTAPEPLRSRSRATPHRNKGTREQGEGSGSRRGRRGETSHHGVALVTREHADGMMTLTRDLEHLDFTPDLPCTTTWCDTAPNPAAYVIEVLGHLPHFASRARAGERKLICQNCWDRVIAQGRGRCGCGAVVEWSQLWRIVEVLR